MMIKLVTFLILLITNFVYAQSIVGNYYAIESKCLINLKIDSKNNYSLTLSNKKNVRGVVKIVQENSTTYLDFGNISSMYDNDTIYIQNSGNSINQYLHFKNCDEKYIHLVKKNNMKEIKKCNMKREIRK